MSNKINLLQTLISKFNSKFGLKLWVSEQSISKIFDRKQFSESDLKFVFNSLMLNKNCKISDTRNGRKFILINNRFKMVICPDGLILSLSDKTNNL